MTRENVYQNISNTQANNMLILLPTGFGKTKIALDKLKIISEKDSINKILIVVPRIVLIQTWKDEFKKWNCSNFLNNVEFVTYVSYPKLNDNYDVIIYDEVHHLSQRCRDTIKNHISRYNIMLSATVNFELRTYLIHNFKDLYIYKVSTRQAIESDVLPDPEVYLIPIQLDNTIKNHYIIKNKDKGNPIIVQYNERFKYKSVQNREIRIQCTQQQYYDNLSDIIAWLKDRNTNTWLQKSGERLKWLSSEKTHLAKIILHHLKDKRTLTFCSNIKQTEELGKYCINSKNKQSKEYLDSFNDEKIDHITACDMLNEGINLVNCQYGVYASLHSSDRLITQQLGRLLRHKNPKIIIPYFVNTRDEELVKKMIEDYNKDLIHTVNNINDIKYV